VSIAAGLALRARLRNQKLATVDRNAWQSPATPHTPTVNVEVYMRSAQPSLADVARSSVISVHVAALAASMALYLSNPALAIADPYTIEFIGHVSVGGFVRAGTVVTGSVTFNPDLFIPSPFGGFSISDPDGQLVWTAPGYDYQGSYPLSGDYISGSYSSISFSMGAFNEHGLLEALLSFSDPTGRVGVDRATLTRPERWMRFPFRTLHVDNDYAADAPFYRAEIASLTGASAPVPEPATLMLFGGVCAGLLATRMRRKKR